MRNHESTNIEVLSVDLIFFEQPLLYSKDAYAEKIDIEQNIVRKSIFMEGIQVQVQVSEAPSSPHSRGRICSFRYHYSIGGVFYIERGETLDEIQPMTPR